MWDAFADGLFKRPLLVVLVAAMLLVSGLYAWKSIPIDAFPDVTNVQVMILTQASGLTPDEVERLISYPIEVQMGGLPGVDSVRSLSRSGLSQVVVVFTDDTDIYFARQLVLERLVSARESLPAGIDPELGPISTGLGEIYQYVVEAGYYCVQHPREWSEIPDGCSRCGSDLVVAEYDSTDLRTFQDWIIAPQLRRIAGVNEVNSFGGFVKQIHVIPNPDQLLKYDISLQDVLESLDSNNANVGGNFLVRDWEQSYLVSRGLLRDESDIRLIVLKTWEGTPIYLGDVAQVRIGGQERQGTVTMDGKGEVVAGMVIMLKGMNSERVVADVKREIPEIEKTLPAGVRINPFYDRTELIEACVRTVSDALMQGGVLVILVLFLFLGDFRAALTVALSLPMMVSVAFILMGWNGITANLMSLGGLAIAIGMIADGAIIVAENITRHLQDSSGKHLPKNIIAAQALKEIIRPLFFAICVIVVVILPLFSLQAHEGKMFKPLAMTVLFAMLGSLLVSLTIVPVLTSLLTNRDRRPGRRDLLLRALLAVHRPVLRIALWGGWHTLAVAAAILVASFALIPGIGTEFLPTLDEGAIAINVVRLPSAALEGSKVQALLMERRLKERFPEIETVVSKTGRAEIAEDPMGPEQNDLVLSLKPKELWTSARTKEELVNLMSLELARIPGIRPAFSQPIALRVNELISGIKSDVAIKILGDDLDELQAIGAEIAPILSGIQGAEDVKLEQVTGFSQTEIHFDRQSLAKHGIAVSEVNEIIETAVGGKVATDLYEGQRRVAVLVRFPEEHRRDRAALERLLVFSPLGYRVPLGDLAEIVEVDAPAQISRENSQRRLLVECNVRGRDIGGFIREAQERTQEISDSLPEGYRLLWGGQFENQQRAAARLRIVLPIALLLIFVLLYTSLNSLKSAFLVFMNLPFAVVGGLIALHLLGINFSVAASIGFIALLGVAVEDGLMLVSFFDQLLAKGYPVREAVFEGCRLRIRSLLMTTMTTVLGLLPLLYSSGSGSELQRPLVAVIFGGLISSLALTLVILPLLYCLTNSSQSKPAKQ